MKGAHLGFTLVELLVVGFFVTTLYLITTQSLFRGHRTTTLTEATSQLVRDLRETQMRAIEGKTTIAGGVVDHSIRFEVDRYIRYPGTVYDSGNPENQVVMLPSTMQLVSISVVDGVVTFARSSGDVRNWTNGSDSVTLSDTGIGKNDVISINKHGVVFVSHE